MGNITPLSVKRPAPSRWLRLPRLDLVTERVGLGVLEGLIDLVTELDGFGECEGWIDLVAEFEG